MFEDLSGNQLTQLEEVWKVVQEVYSHVIRPMTRLRHSLSVTFTGVT